MNFIKNALRTEVPEIRMPPERQIMKDEMNELHIVDQFVSNKCRHSKHSMAKLDAKMLSAREK